MNRGTRKERTMKLGSFMLVVCLFQASLEPVMAQTAPIDRVIEAVEAIKEQNFYVQTLGILVSGDLSENEVNQLQNVQKAIPRHMRILVTQNEMIRDVFHDFTYLAKDRKVDAILVWPAEVWDDPSFQKKVCQMSMRTKVPVVGLQDGWLDQGALLEFSHTDGTSVLLANQRLCDRYNYIPAPVEGYSVLNQ